MALAKYHFENVVLGTGSFGQVKLARHKQSGAKVAIKIIDRNKLSVLSRRRIADEVAILSSLKHEGICQLIEVIEDNRYIYIVLERANGGDLYEYLNKRGKLTEREVRCLAKQMCLALKYCHDNQVVHHDVKLENIMLSNGDGEFFSGKCKNFKSELDLDTTKIKLIDFGFAVKCLPGTLLSKFSGTEAYAAPELLAGKAYDGIKADIYSLGVVLYILLTARYPFSDDVEVQCEEQKSTQYLNDLEFPSGVSKEIRALILMMLEPNPVRRPGWARVLAHPIFIEQGNETDEDEEGEQEFLPKGKGKGRNIYEEETDDDDEADENVNDCAKAKGQAWVAARVLAGLQQHQQGHHFESYYNNNNSNNYSYNNKNNYANSSKYVISCYDTHNGDNEANTCVEDMVVASQAEEEAGTVGDDDDEEGYDNDDWVPFVAPPPSPLVLGSSSPSSYSITQHSLPWMIQPLSSSNGFPASSSTSMSASAPGPNGFAKYQSGIIGMGLGGRGYASPVYFCN
jgi:serine/threonine protein kinase